MTFDDVFDKLDNALAIIFTEKEGDSSYDTYVKLTNIETAKVSQAIARLIQRIGLDMQSVLYNYALLNILDNQDEEDSDNVC